MEHRRTDVALLAVAAVWGSSYLAAKVAVGDAPVPAVLAGRYTVAAIACLAVVVVRRASLPTRGELRVGAVLGCSQAVVLGLETWGVAGTTASHAGVLISLTIMITPGLETLTGGARLPPAFYGCGLLCVAGVALLLGGRAWSRPGGGDLLIVAAALVRAAHVVLTGRIAPRRRARPLPVTCVQLVVGAVVFVPWSAAAGSMTMRGSGYWPAVIYLGLGASVFAFVVQTWAVQATSASRSSLLLGTEPLWALLVGVLVGGDSVGVVAGVGAALVVVGTYLGQAVEGRHRTMHGRTRRRRGSTCATPTHA